MWCHSWLFIWSCSFISLIPTAKSLDKIPKFSLRIFQLTVCCLIQSATSASHPLWADDWQFEKQWAKEVCLELFHPLLCRTGSPQHDSCKITYFENLGYSAQGVAFTTYPISIAKVFWAFMTYSSWPLAFLNFENMFIIVLLHHFVSPQHFLLEKQQLHLYIAAVSVLHLSLHTWF